MTNAQIDAALDAKQYAILAAWIDDNGQLQFGYEIENFPHAEMPELLERTRELFSGLILPQSATSEPPQAAHAACNEDTTDGRS